MEVLHSLGLDGTVVYQLAIFFIAYFFLSTFLFKPYLQAFEQRQNKTVGQVNQAEKMGEKTNELNEELFRLQKELNIKVQESIQRARDEGGKEVKLILDSARTEAENYLSQAGQKVAKDVNEAKKTLEASIPQISETIVQKLVGRNI